MNVQDHARKLIESGLPLRKMRTAFQVELLRRAEDVAGTTSYKQRMITLGVGDDAIRHLERRRQALKAHPLSEPLRLTVEELTAKVTRQLGTLNYHKVLASVDREIAKAAVVHAKRKCAAARLLGVHRNTLTDLLNRTTIMRQI